MGCRRPAPKSSHTLLSSCLTPLYHLALPTYTNPPVTSTHHLLISVTSVMSYKCRVLWHTEGRGSSHTPLRLKVLAGGLAGAQSRMLCSLESREGGGAHQDDGACGRGVIFLARCRDLSSHACVVLDLISTPSIHTYIYIVPLKSIIHICRSCVEIPAALTMHMLNAFHISRQ